MSFIDLVTMDESQKKIAQKIGEFIDAEFQGYKIDDIDQALSSLRALLELKRENGETL